MDIQKNLTEIYKLTDNVFSLASEVSVEWVERNFLILMGIYDTKIYNKVNVDVEVTEEWIYPFNENIQLAFDKRELFSQAFVNYYEIWFQKDNDLPRIVMGSRLNDYCLSELVYEKIKANKKLFETLWMDEDSIDLWESATYLFERYDKKPFSLERYNRIYG